MSNFKNCVLFVKNLNAPSFVEEFAAELFIKNASKLITTNLS